MELSSIIKKTIADFKKDNYYNFDLHEVNGPWDFTLRFDTKHTQNIIIRNIEEGDEQHLLEFKEKLSAKSQDLFCPYPWNDEKKLRERLTAAVRNSINKIDASYIVIADTDIAGHFFLWKAGNNPHSKQYGVEIPELGIAIRDDYHGKGLGTMCMRILESVARYLKRDAIELTTAMNNDAGWNLYLREGYEFKGIIKNPLEIDVTSAINHAVNIDKYREERQMVLILNKEKYENINKYLASKRKST
jgi:ribosomal protein S18 acetylase RimI-like enzyme